MARRDTTSAERRARAAGLDPTVRFENWDDEAAVTYDRATLDELASLRFVGAGHNALTLGPVGVGKTFLARPSRTRRRRQPTGPLQAARRPPRMPMAPNGTLHVVYSNLEGNGNRPANLWISTSTDGNRTLSPPDRVAGAPAFQPRLAVAGVEAVDVVCLGGGGRPSQPRECRSGATPRQERLDAARAGKPVKTPTAHKLRH